MSDNPTREEVLKSIVPKSDQLNADDLQTGPITVTITKVSRGDKDQPLNVEVDGRQPFKPCKSMRRVLIAVFSDDPKQWVGQRLTLYCDPDVTWAGVKVGGIRISHMSGIDNPRTFSLTRTRGKRSDVTVRPLAPAATEQDLQDEATAAPSTISAEDQAYIASALKLLNESKTTDDLRANGLILKGKSKVIRDAVRPAAEKRKAELEALK